MLRNKLYYGLKPFIPQTIRTSIRRSFAQRKRERVRDVWPILPGSERTPDDWPGWPDGKKFGLVLTHDVERKGGLTKCQDLMHLELDRGFRSSFNFIPEGDYKVPDELRAELIANGFEVGIHDLKHDGKLYNSYPEFLRRASRINSHLKGWNTVGFRSGFMLRNLRWLRSLDLLYDSSTFDTDPFEPQPDGAGTIFPFWIPDDEGHGYVELPYTLPQDSTLFLLFKEQNIDIWKKKLAWIAEHGGMALVNVHPDYMDFNYESKETVYPARFYEEFLEHVATEYEGQYWNGLPRDVARHAVNAWQETVKNSVTVSLSRMPGLPSLDSLAKPIPSPLPENGMNTAGSRSPVGKPPKGVSNSPFKSPHQRSLAGKRALVLLFSHFPGDARPRRAAEALAEEGMKVEMLCLSEGRGEPKREVVDGIEIRRLPIQRKRGGALGYFRQYSSFILYTFAIATTRSFRRRYDLVHVHNMPDVLVFSSLTPRLFGARVILDLHDPMPELMMTIFGFGADSGAVRLLKFLEKLSIGFAHKVLTVNRACHKIFAARSCAFEKVDVIMNSPNEEIFGFKLAELPKTRDPDRPFAIMYHGSIVERHGLDLAVTALAKIRKAIPQAELRICGGKTAFLDKVLESVRGTELESAVRSLGPMSHEEISAEIDRCDVGVIPNRRSIFTELNTPTRIFEYLSRGKPVIAPSAPGIEDYFERDQLIFFELGNAEDLAEKMAYVYANPVAVEETVRAGQQVYSNHLWSRERSRFLTLVGELTSTNK